jgi:membrane peptidoglycan carboxypeptidase
VTHRLTYRANLILSRLLEYHHISEKEYHEALDELEEYSHSSATNQRERISLTAIAALTRSPSRFSPFN